MTEGKEIIHRFDIPSDISNQIIKECLTISEILSVLAINEAVALTNNRKETESMNASHYKYTDFSNDYNYRYLKISLVATNQAAVEKIAANYPMCDMLRYTGEDLYRFANRNAVKWNAVTAIAKHYNVSTDMFVAFGDDINDLEMIQKCGQALLLKTLSTRCNQPQNIFAIQMIMMVLLDGLKSKYYKTIHIVGENLLWINSNYVKKPLHSP